MQQNSEYDHMAEERLESNILQGYCIFSPAVHSPCLVGAKFHSPSVAWLFRIGAVFLNDCSFSSLCRVFYGNLGLQGRKNCVLREAYRYSQVHMG